VGKTWARGLERIRPTTCAGRGRARSARAWAVAATPTHPAASNVRIASSARQTLTARVRRSAAPTTATSLALERSGCAGRRAARRTLAPPAAPWSRRAASAAANRTAARSRAATIRRTGAAGCAAGSAPTASRVALAAPTAPMAPHAWKTPGHAWGCPRGATCVCRRCAGRRRQTNAAASLTPAACVMPVNRSATVAFAASTPGAE
jgi:hypothetical protein